MSEKKKLLIISYFYPPVGGIGLPGCMRVVKFIKYLEDWDISVVTVHPDKYPAYFGLDNKMSLPIRNEIIHYTSVTDIFKYIINVRSRLFGNKVAVETGSISIKEINSFGTITGNGNKNILERIKRTPKKIKDFVHDICYFPDHASPWIPNAIVEGFKIIKKEKPDIMFATGMPWSVLIIANMLHKLTGVPYVCDFRDPWVDNPYHNSKGSLFNKMNKYFEKDVVKNSALVTANTLPLKMQFMTRYPQSTEGKIAVLPNGYDPKDFNFVAENTDKSASDTGVRLVHAGFLYGERNPLPILNAITIVHEKYKYPIGNIAFVQIGSMENNIKMEMEKFIESGVAKCIGQLPHAACMKTLRDSDVLVIIQQGTETQIPSKIYEYICLNRPILTITKRGGALWNLLEEYKFGDLFEPDEIGKIAEKINGYYIRKKSVGFLEEEYPMKNKFDIRKITRDLSDHMMRIAGIDQ